MTLSLIVRRGTVPVRRLYVACAALGSSAEWHLGGFYCAYYVNKQWPDAYLDL